MKELTDAEWADVQELLKARNGQIKQLKAENQKLQDIMVKRNLKEDFALITELVDALDRSDPIQISIQEVAALIDRAREATR